VTLGVELVRLPDVAALGAEWQALEDQADASFFTGWTWTRCWLQHLGDAAGQLLLLRVRQGDETVGLGLWSPRTLRRLRWLPSRALLLHATGDPAFDDLTAEHNALLSRAGLADEVAAAALPALLARQPRLGQVVVPRASVLSPALAQAACHAGLRLRSWGEPAYRIDLEAARAGRGCHLDGLGAATRSTVRRSLRLYEALGPVRLEAAASAQEALAHLERLAHWHQRHWQARGQPGAFANPRFAAFHRRLVVQAFDSGCIWLLRLAAGAHEIGYLYAFVHRGQVLAYQSGLRSDVVARNHHPGLVLHALAVQHAADAGLAGYDLMAGDARYKQQLGSQGYPMLSYSLHRPGPALWLEEGWRGLKAWCRAAPGRARAAGSAAGRAAG
jgi:CelD/BcsL family acetyltransferase involved in cellulose biosynthesis